MTRSRSATTAPVSIVCDYAKDNLNDTIDNNHVVIAEAVNGFGINLLLISRSLASDIGVAYLVNIEFLQHITRMVVHKNNIHQQSS